MRSLIHIVLLFIGFISQAQIVTIPDAVFKDLLVNEAVADLNGDGEFDSDVDTNDDGEIQVSEAEAVLGLSIWTNVIESLEGIEYFTNLTFLRCVNNLLTSLDVSALVQLEILKCYSNNLETLNVNGLTQLTQLWIAFNQLETIELSTLQSLDWIFCSSNDLNSLDVSGLNNLRAIWADDNNIPSIDLTDNDLLYDVSLSSNLFQSIEVNFLQDLVFLNLADNLLTEIDISNMPNLLEIRVGHNDITDLDCSSTGADIIHCENNLNLTTINVQNDVISGSDPDLLYFGFYFYDLPNLEFICMDPGEEQALADSGYDPSNVIVATGPDCTVGISELTFESIIIYPNPVKDILQIENNSISEIQSVEVFDLFGKLVLSSNKDQHQLNVSFLKRGVFLLKIETNKGSLIKKLIKQ